MLLTRSGRPIVLLYLLAGVPLGIFAEVVPVFLRTSGMSLEQIGWYAGINLLYSFKVFFAPLVDRLGRLRTWLQGLALLLALAYVSLGYAAGKLQVETIACALLLMTSASAFYDIALDATFARSLEDAPPAQHASANAWRLSSFKAAMVAVGSLGVICGGRMGFATTFFGVAALHTLLMCVVCWQQLPNDRPRELGTAWLAPFFVWLKTRQTLYAFLLAFLYKLSIASFLWMEKPFWLDRGMSLETIGTCTALMGLVGTLVGANAGSRLVYRFGVPALMFAGLALQSLLGLGYFALTYVQASAPLLCVGLMLSGTTFGLSTAALMNLITRMCQKEHAATQFAALTGCYMFARALGGQLAGHLAEHYGYQALFAGVALLVLPAALVIPRAQVASPPEGAAT